jgi:hypothetical protein
VAHDAFDAVVTAGCCCGHSSHRLIAGVAPQVGALAAVQLINRRDAGNSMRSKADYAAYHIRMRAYSVR